MTEKANETVPGGRYLVNDVYVNAEGEVLKDQGEKAVEKDVEDSKEKTDTAKKDK